ncbi:MAG: sodium/alanine symporter [Bacteroidetes bacterium]|jgi:alanine or glycine:cation symporter, AGCS family|nr:sodium/alanine symporter [Bacteroidota bacterium]MAC05923.1 sodium/alanine symporter [Balneola sp.]MAO77448.1 sodium/alanine symporter [Balneola sp.]MBF65406.1 sodium/alanine symporter [Balneola sp.]|tara:strand:+ start:3370 stop:4704 length:1335 start_codon:yes stop_codon:yes gene_type:complete
MWGTPLVVLLVGGGLFFLIYSRFIPYRYFFHSINILRGKYDDPNDPGDISHFEALASALAATVGLGNISGVAVAIAIGGPGAVFWMWISAIVGMATKFFTCTLSIMYRGKDSNGDIQGGTMYMIMEGLGKKWKPLAVLFAVAGLFGPLPIFQANQVTQIVRDFVLIPNGLADAANHFNTDLISGIVILAIVSLVIFGGIKRVGKVASKMVPAMVVIYVACVLVIIGINIDMLGSTFALIFTDAFTANSAMGGALGALIVTGVRRAAFSNEAGIGTATLAHGAAKTKEPVREGLVAMMGPFIDTLVVCTMTALAILVTGVWQSGDENGITLTASAFEAALGPYGVYLLIFCVLIFGFSSLFTYSYYSTKCLGFLIGADKQKYFNFFYAAAIIFGSVATIQAVLNFTDGMFALMAIPTMTVAILLSPKVMAAAKDYFGRMEKKEIL